MSAVLHLLILLLIVWRPGSDANADRAAGGFGLPGGGGGRGAPRINLILLPSYQSSTREVAVSATEPVAPVEAFHPEIVPISRPLAQIQLTPRRELAAVLVRGVGDGVRRAVGLGTGAGGGVGSGRGTGRGAAEGPGTGEGGGGGDAFPPKLIEMLVPPTDRPDAVKGRSFELRFWVDENGRVTHVSVEPAIGDAQYHERFIRTMYDFFFEPATDAEGMPIPGETVITITL